jgi:hypothetical protein
MSDTDTDLERFLDDLCHELRLRGCHALRSEVRQWVHDAWPPIAEDPAVSRWAAAWREVYPQGA